jgi:FAD:protein FMN transferase
LVVNFCHKQTRQSHSSQWLCFILPLLFVLLAGCSSPDQTVKLSGAAMGTTWHVTYVVPAGYGQDRAAVEQGIIAQLERVEQSMSTWRDSSEISQFNAAAVGQWFELSADFNTVLAASLDIGSASDGAFDVSVAPLVDLWGFGPARKVASSYQPPPDRAIKNTLAQTGQQYLNLDRVSLRARKQRELALDFSSIAKGYGVDVVADWLLSQQLQNFLVEVGGELRLSGNSPRGDAWRVAIEQPGLASSGVAQAIGVSDVAVATSGDYRNYFEHEGVRYSHTIDPRTGRPVTHNLVSVTVLHASAMMADGWATALSVMGAQEGARVASEYQLAVYFIERSEAGFTTSYSEAFEPYLAGSDKVGSNGSKREN